MQASGRFVLFSGIMICCSCLSSAGVLAQAQVVDAGSSRSDTQTTQPSPDNSQNEVMVNMYLQLEALQNEIQNLRGLVEEQSYQIRRMQTEQRDRYLDTDSRLTELNNQVRSFHGGQGAGVQDTAILTPGQDTPGVSANQVTNTPATGTQDSTVASGAAVGVSTPQNEQDLYRLALNTLLEDEAFADSITLFQQYIDIYPQGRYFTNALYWQGAALELAGRYNQAVTVLQRLIDQYPEDAKAPTAMLRLGTVYKEMGDTARAISNWRRISELYPDSSSEIEIASEYLSEIGN